MSRRVARKPLVVRVPTWRNEVQIGCHIRLGVGNGGAMLARQREKSKNGGISPSNASDSSAYFKAESLLENL